MKLLIFVSMIFLIQSCATVTSTIPLTDEFKSNAKKVTLKAPSWRIPDSVFDMPVGKFKVSNTDLSLTRSTTKLTNKRREGGSLIEWLLFDDTGAIINEFSVDSSRSFSFDMLEGERLISKTNCGLFSQSLKEKIAKSERDELPTSGGIDQRERTFLSCVIKHGDEKWELTLDSTINGPLSASLRAHNDEIFLDEIATLIHLNETGEVVGTVPPWRSQRAGLSFHYQYNQISVISFESRSDFWVKNNLPTSIEELIFTVNYALTLFNWVDNDWRES